MSPKLIGAKISRLTESDISQLLELATEIGWGYNRANWLQFLNLGIVVGHRLENDRVISCAVMVRYGASLNWLTSFIVSPSFQRRGLAQDLWLFLKNQIPDSKTPVGLVSTVEGLPFYQSMGFKESRSVHKFVRANGVGIVLPNVQSVSRIVSVNSIDQLKIIEMDKLAVGLSRAEMIESKLSNCVSAVKAIDDKQQTCGFAIAVVEGDQLCIGPVVARDWQTALNLILTVAVNYNGPMRLDIVANNELLRNELLTHGFLQSRIAPVLSYGDIPLPSVQREYFALAAQALG
jgi:hypothetical protein